MNKQISRDEEKIVKAKKIRKERRTQRLKDIINDPLEKKKYNVLPKSYWHENYQNAIKAKNVEIYDAYLDSLNPKEAKKRKKNKTLKKNKQVPDRKSDKKYKKVECVLAKLKEHYREIIDRSDQIRYLYQVLEDRLETHEIFFATFTSNTKVSYSDFKAYFELLNYKLNKVLLCDNRQYKEAPIFILFPEMSEGNLPIHWHGFILIHKSTLKKFNKFCVREVIPEEVESLDNKIRDNYYLKDAVLDSNFRNIPKSATTQARYDNRQEIDSIDADSNREMSKLVIGGYKLYKISTFNDFGATMFYSTKNFLHCQYEELLYIKSKPREDKAGKKRKKTNNHKYMYVEKIQENPDGTK